MKKTQVVSVFIIGFIFLSIHGSAFAGRPLSTEDAGVVGKRSLAAEIGFEYARQDNKDNNYGISLVPIYGLTEYMQFCAGLPFNIKCHKDESCEAGLGDITLSLKTLLSPEKEIMPAFALKTDLKLANGNNDKGLGSGDEDFRFILAATKVISPVTLHGNIGYTFVGTKADSSLSNAVLYGVALEYALTPKLTIVSEAYGESDSQFDTGAFDEHKINPLIGLTYRINEKMILDAAFKMGICHEEKTEYGIIGGMSISF